MKLIDVIKNGKVKEALDLIESGADIHARDEENSTALIEACSSKKWSVASVLIEKNVDVNVANRLGSTALIEATSWGHEKTIKLLIAAGADVNLMPGTIRDEEFEKIDQHYEENEDPIINGLSMNGQPWIEDLNIQESDLQRRMVSIGTDSSTALHRAASFDRIEIVKILIMAGADINIKNNDGKTPLESAIESNADECIEYLKSIGAK